MEKSKSSPAISFTELLGETKKLKIDQLRTDTDVELEFVMRTDTLDTLHPTLEKYFGAAIKPAGVEPSKEVEEITSSMGGVWRNQTFYYLMTDGTASCAMIWPWGDGKSATVKIIKL